MTQNLTKENFWDELEKKFPDAVEKFKNWIDDYKVEVGWESLFQLQPGMQDTLKFHHIPFEMQSGIIGRFIVENMAPILGTRKQKYLSTMKEYRNQHLIDMFQTIQEDLNKVKEKLN